LVAPKTLRISDASAELLAEVIGGYEPAPKTLRISDASAELLAEVIGGYEPALR
jgi:hypothetical protein